MNAAQTIVYPLLDLDAAKAIHTALVGPEPLPVSPSTSGSTSGESRVLSRTPRMVTRRA